MAFALTEEQSRAVHDRGGGLLVSAAAGSVLYRPIITPIPELSIKSVFSKSKITYLM